MNVIKKAKNKKGKAIKTKANKDHKTVAIND